MPIYNSWFSTNEIEHEIEACLTVRKAANMKRVQDHCRTTLSLKMALENWRSGQKERNTLS